MTKILPFQNELQRVLPIVIGNAEYNNFKKLLFRIAEIIELSSIEKKAIEYILDRVREESSNYVGQEENNSFELSEQLQLSIQGRVRLALRVTIARKLTQQSFRPFSVRLAESQLLQHFCKIGRIDKIQVPSKSTLERYEKMFPEQIIREMNTILLKAAISPELKTEENRLKLEESISLDEYFADSTAVKANIHYPVDWVLLRDATRTIMKAEKLIRDQGLKNRVDAPADFIKAINKLMIEMTHTKGKKDSKILKESIERLEKEYDNYSPLSATTDRGFFSKSNQKFLKKKGIKDYMCPRSVSELQKRLKEDDFCEHQKCRAQTEGRIGIVKNSFLGNPSKGKSFDSRNFHAAWSVLSHNLWVLARLPEVDVGKMEQVA